MNLKSISLEVSTNIVVKKQKVDKPTAVILTGLQYAGKSYLSRQIAKKNYAHFWATKIKVAYGIQNPEMISIVLDTLKRVTRDGFNIVIDFSNDEYETRKLFRSKASSLDINLVLVFLDTPKAVRLERQALNIQTGSLPGRRLLSLQQMQQLEDEYDMPRKDENMVILRDSEDIERFIKKL